MLCLVGNTYQQPINTSADHYRLLSLIHHHWMHVVSIWKVKDIHINARCCTNRSKRGKFTVALRWNCLSISTQFYCIFDIHSIWTFLIHLSFHDSTFNQDTLYSSTNNLVCICKVINCSHRYSLLLCFLLVCNYWTTISNSSQFGAFFVCKETMYATLQRQKLCSTMNVESSLCVLRFFPVSFKLDWQR